MEKNILKIFSIYLYMGGTVEVGPPLSTILGNVGIVTAKFCKELNDFVKDLPKYFLLEVKIKIFFDKTYKFIICEPSTALLLKLLSKKIEIKSKSTLGQSKLIIVNAITLENIFLISFFKFNNISNNSLKSIFGTLSSLNYHIIEK